MRKLRLREAKQYPIKTQSQRRQGLPTQEQGADDRQPMSLPHQAWHSCCFCRPCSGPTANCSAPWLPAGSRGGLEDTPLPTHSCYCYVFLREATFASDPSGTAGTVRQHVRSAQSPRSISPTPSPPLGETSKRLRGAHRPRLPCPLDLGCRGKRPLSPGIPGQALTNGDGGLGSAQAGGWAAGLPGSRAPEQSLLGLSSGSSLSSVTLGYRVLLCKQGLWPLPSEMLRG